MNATSPDLFHWQLTSFEQLSNREMFNVLRLRQAIFVVEQECAYPDIDEIDLEALHLIAYFEREKHGEPVMYARILKPGLSYQHASIGRVLVAPSARGKNYGRLLMQKAISETQAHYPGEAIKIGAQHALEKFYQNLGFTTTSEVYLEDGIPHIEMLLNSSNRAS